MHVNYEFMLERCSVLVPTGGRILYYGCGKGMVVEEGLRRHLDFYGVEAFSHGSGTNILDELESKQLLGKRVLGLDESSIPFPDGYFDLVVSKQVFEHIVDLTKALDEIARVLSPYGKLLCLFPSKEVVKEGHCGILFAHWLSKSKARYYWLMFARALGFGRLKHKRGAGNWATFFNNWLDESVSYRTIEELNQEFSHPFCKIENIEDDYLSFRFSGGKLKVVSWLSKTFPFNKFLAWLYRKWAGLVLVATKCN